MDDKLQNQISTILQSAIDAAQKGGQWLAGQIPDVLQQLIYWTVAQGICALVLYAIYITVAVFLYKKSIIKIRDDFARQIYVVLTGMLGVFLLIPTLSQASDALKAIVAPKLFLLQYAIDLIKH